MPRIKDNPIFNKQPIVRVSHTDCLNNYKIYEHPKFKSKSKKKQSKHHQHFVINKDIKEREFIKKHNALPIIEGMKIETNDIKEHVLLESLYEGHSLFSNDSFFIIPKEYNEVKITKKKRKELKSLICKKTPEKIINLEKKGLNWIDWKYEARNKWLTIKDIQNLKKGQKIKVLMLDRNTEDRVYGSKEIKPNKTYKPKTLFKYCWGIYIHNKDLEGELYYQWDLPIKKQKKTKKSKLKEGSTFKVGDKHNNSNKYDFEFDIEYKNNSWYPLENGFLPGKKEIPSFIMGGLLDGKKKRWNKLPKDTNVGWRGPMILWNELDTLPNCYYFDFDKL